MRLSLLLCVVFGATACNQGPLAGAKEEKKEDGTGSETKTGTLAVGEQTEAEVIAASTSLQQIADGFVPSSMKTVAPWWSKNQRMNSKSLNSVGFSIGRA